MAGETTRALRAAVIGVRHGHIAEFFTATRKTDGVTLVGIAEDDPALAREYGARWEVPVYATADELFERERPDVVGLATTNDAKAGAAAACLERGVSAIADKPLFTDVEGLERVRGLLGRTPARLSLMLTCRFSRGYRAVADLIERGALGKVAHIATFGPHRLRPQTRHPWMLDDARSGGILVDIGIHYFDLLRWFTGEEAAQVSAYDATTRFTDLPGFTDHGHALVTFPGGAAGYVSVDWLTPEASAVHGDYRLFVTGSRGYCELHAAGDVRLTLTTDEHGSQDVPLAEAKPTPSEDFLAALRDGREPALDVEDVLRSSELALRARAAAQAGRGA